MIDDDLDQQIAATQAELGVAPAHTSNFKSLHSLVNFNFASTKPKPKPNASFTTSTKADKAQQSPLVTLDDLELDLQISNTKAELDRVRVEGDHFRYRGEQQRKKSQENLKKHTLTLQTSIKQRQCKTPDSLTRKIVEETFNDPSRNRFCLDMEIKNVYAISKMWWMHRQQVLQLEALDKLNELLDSERTKLQAEAHKNRARMLMLAEKITPLVDNLQVEQEYRDADLDQQRMEASILNRQKLTARNGRS